MAAVTICSDFGAPKQSLTLFPPSAVIWEPQNIKSNTVSTVSPSISHEVIGPDAMIFIFWMLSFKPTFSTYTPVKQGKKINEPGLGPLTKDNCLSVFHKQLEWYPTSLSREKLCNVMVDPQYLPNSNAKLRLNVKSTSKTAPCRNRRNPEHCTSQLLCLHSRRLKATKVKWHAP